MRQLFFSYCLIIVILLTGCRQGGSSDQPFTAPAEPEPPASPPGQLDPEPEPAPRPTTSWPSTKQQSLIIDAANAEATVREYLSKTEYVHQVALGMITPILYTMRYDIPADGLYGGVLCIDNTPPQLNYTDLDGNQRLSAGETLEVTFPTACLLAPDLMVSGSISIELSHATWEQYTGHESRGEMTLAIELTPNYEEDPPVQVSGRFSFDYATDTVNMSMLVTGDEAALQFEHITGQATLGDFTLQERFRRNIQGYHAYDLDFTGALDSTQLGGSYQCLTELEVSGNSVDMPYRHLPADGLLYCQGQGEALVRYETRNYAHTLAIIANENAPAEILGMPGWRELVRGIIFQDWTPKPEHRPETLATVPTERISLQAANAVYSKTQGKLYVAVPTGAASYAQSLVEVDPVSQTITGTVALDGDPDAMALSADGALVYVGYHELNTVHGIDLENLTIQQTLDLGSETDKFGRAPPWGYWLAHSIAVSPVDSNQVLVAKRGYQGRTIYYISLYKNGVELPASITYPVIQGAGFSKDGTKVYGPSSSGGIKFYSVDASGLTTGSQWYLNDLGDGSVPQIVGNSYYTRGGRHLDLDNGHVLGKFGGKVGYAISRSPPAIEPGQNRSYYVHTDLQASGPNRTLEIYELDHYRFMDRYAFTATGDTLAVFISNQGDALVVTSEELHTIRSDQLTPSPYKPCTSISYIDVITNIPFVQMDCSFTDAVYNATDNYLYASVSSFVEDRGNSIAFIDVNAASVEEYVYVGSEPQRLALSADGSTLYLGMDGASQLASFDTSSRQVTNTIALKNGDSVYSRPLWVSDIAVDPSNSDTILVAKENRHGLDSAQPYGVTRYSGGVASSNITQFGSRPDQVVYSNHSGEAFGIDDYIKRYSVDSAGIALLEKSTVDVNGELKRAGIKLYTGGGQVVDIETLATLSLAAPGDRSFAVEADLPRDRIYYYAIIPGSNGMTGLRIHRLGDGALLDYVPLPRMSIEDDGDALALVNCGADKLCVVAENRLYIVSKDDLP